MAAPTGGSRPAGLATMLGRALRRRCLACGGPELFAGWFTLRDRCPACGFGYEREEGYWVGAMILNLGGAQLLFLAIFVGGMLGTWPDVPWTGLWIGGVATMVAFPILFYPYSKTLWVWGDLWLNPRGGDAQARARH